MKNTKLQGYRAYKAFSKFGWELVNINGKEIFRKRF